MASKDQLRSMLSGGDRRFVGRVAEIAELVRQYPTNIGPLIECIRDTDACVRMRAADALEKACRGGEISLQSYKVPLLRLLEEATQQEVRWHLAVMVPRLSLTDAECRRVAEILHSYLEDRSSILRALAMQGLADLTEQYTPLRPAVISLIGALTETGTPAMRARGRKLLKKLGRQRP